MATIEIQDGHFPWMRVASFVDGATLIFGRNHFPSKPKSVSRSELEFSLTGTNAMVKQVGSNSTYLLADGETRKLATGESASLVDGCIIALDKSRMHKARFVLQPPAEVHALSSDEEVLEPQHVAAEIYALSSDAESPPTKPLEPQRVAAKPLEQQRVSAQHVAPQRVVAQPVAVDVDASDDEVEVVAPRNKGADRREGKRPRRPPPPVADSSVVVDVIDLEAATGVGVGVSGKPLLPGELEARQQRYRKTWTLRATRSTDDTPEEQHYRFAESAWCRGGGMANQISAVEYHFHPTLEARWHSKKAEYDSRFGVGGHTILFAFHGTRPGNVQLILNDGFRVSKVGSTTDAGFFGAGIYFSEHMTHSQGYNSGNDGMFLCKILVGKPFLCPQQNGRGLEPGYTSHVADPSGSEVVIFDDAAMAPPAPARAWCGENFPSWAFYLKWDQSALPLQDNPKAGATSYRIVGDLVRESKAGVPPILVVGAPGIGYEYLENFEALTVSDRRVVFVALAGTAPASSSSSTFDTSLATPEAGAAQLAGVCKSLGLPAVHVVAHGLGAPAALRFAASSTSVVRSLTLSSPYGSVADLRQGALDLSSVKSLPQLAGLLLPTVSTNARDTCVAEARTAGGGPVLLPALTGASPFASLGGAKLGERLTALRGTGSSLPVLLASGGARDLVDADAWVDVPPWVSRKRFGGSGHLPFVEERDAFLLSCLEFLDGVDGKETNREFKFGDPVATIKEIAG